MGRRHRITIEPFNVGERRVRALLIEDSDDDALLVQYSLEQAGYRVESERVDTEPALRAVLAERTWDVVLADFSMPCFDALRALEVVKECAPSELPFIIVSGAIGEETAVAAMRAGAHDYVHKSKLERLAPVVERELRAAAERIQGAILHKRMMHTERLAAIGKLAAGVAHEINNPLAFMLGNMEVMGEYAEQVRVLISVCEQAAHEPMRAARMLRDFLGQEDMIEVLDEMEDIRILCLSGVERIASIVRDLKTFSRLEDDDIELIDVNQAAATACDMVENTVRHRARLVRNFSDVPRFPGDLGKLTQVLVNLLVNAAQAISEGDATCNQITVATESDGDGVTIKVIDTGRGIPADLLEHIFEPFFTTKSRDEGTGLGLSLCADIIRRHRGQITVESAPGQGASFILRVPIVNGLKLGRKARPTATTAATCHGPARILLIDDEPEILRSYQRALAEEHHLVLAASAEEALEVLEHGSEYDLVFCDVMLPGLDGPGLYEALQRRWPGLAERMIFITGGALSERSRNFLDGMGERVLEKPVAPQRLLQLVAGRSRWVGLPADGESGPQGANDTLKIPSPFQDSASGPVFLS